jgi:hypothetical protein
MAPPSQELEPPANPERFKPLEGKGPLNSAEWWKTPWGRPFTVPAEADGRCDEWAFQRLISDLMKCAPPGWNFDD